MSTINKLRKNISLSFIYNFLMQVNITSAIWVLYLAFKGMSLVEIGLLESIFHITSLLFELPTGAIADIYGKKFSVVLGRVVSVIASILMITSNNFLGFTIAFILTAASYNLNSGAAEALVYDSLRCLGEENRYKKLWGSISFYMSIGQGLAVLAGGILADVNFLYAYILGTIIQGGAMIAALQFYEPEVSKNKTSGSHKRNALLHQLITSVNVLKVRKMVLYLILFSTLSASLHTTVFFYSQKYFSDMNYTKTVIAIIYTAGSFIEAFSSKYAYRLEELLKISGTLFSVAVLNILSLGGLAFFKNLSIVFFLLTSITSGLGFTLFSDYINSRIPSEYRATILSFDSLCFSIFMIAVFPLFGILAQKIGFTVTFGVTALLYIPLMIFLMLKFNKHKE